MKLTCQNCGAELPEDTLFCTECGARISAPASDSPPAYIPAPSPYEAAAAEPVRPVEPVQPIRPIQPVQPVRPVQPIQPVRPIQPVQPVRPVPPVQSAQMLSSNPVRPAEPVQPYAPAPEQYRQPQPPMQTPLPPYGGGRPPKGSPWEPVSAFGYFGILLLLGIPVVGWVFAIVWACNGCRKKQKSSIARGWLLYTVMMAVISLLLCLCLWLFALPAINMWLEPYGFEISDEVLNGTAFQSQPADPTTGGTKPSPSSDSSQSEQPPTPASGTPAERLGAMFTGDYYMEYTMEVLGMEVTGEQAKSGDRTYTHSEVFGIEGYQLTAGDTNYTYDPDKNIYYVGSSDVSAVDTDTYSNLDGATVNGTGTDVFDGKTLSYTEYELNDGSETTLTFYYDDERVYGIMVSTMDIEMPIIFHTLTSEIPAGLLELPEGCTEVTEEEFLAQTSDF